MPKILRAIGSGVAGFLLSFVGMFLLASAIYWPLHFVGIDATGLAVLMNFSCILVCPLAGLYYARKGYKRKKR